MNSEAYGTTTFCDDIRFETNGKITLVGCYQNELNFSGPAPGLLPSFAALVNLRIPRDIEFKKIRFSVTKEHNSEKEEIFQAEIEIPEEDRKKNLSPEGKEKPEGIVLSMTTPMRWSPLPIDGECLIKVRAYLDDDTEVRLGSLKIGFKESTENLEEAQ